MDAGYYPQIVGRDGAMSKQHEDHHKRRRIVRTRHEGEWGQISSTDIKRLEKGILVLREQLNRAAETVLLKDKELIKLNKDYRVLC